MVNLNVYEKTQKKRKKELDNDKSIKYKKSLLIVLDLCQANYHTLLIIYLKFTAKSVEGVKKERKSQHAILLDLIIINCIINATNVKEDQ